MSASWAVTGGLSGWVLDQPAAPLLGELQLLVGRTTRLQGTRAIIHTHEWGGITCLEQGEMTLLCDTMPEPVTALAGGCYYMPPRRMMTAMSTGNVPALMFDMFVVPSDRATLTTVGEDSYHGMSLMTNELLVESEEVKAAVHELCTRNTPPYTPVAEIFSCECVVVQNQTTGRTRRIIADNCPLAPGMAVAMSH